jgi:hypothetical protein
MSSGVDKPFVRKRASLYMPGTFQVSLGWYSYPQIILNAATPDQVAFLKRAIGAYRSDDIFHQKKQPSDPYAEAMSTDLVHVTFGGTTEQAQEYVDWLNSVYDETVRSLYIKIPTNQPLDV